MLKIRSRGFDCTHYCICLIYDDIKFSKQIGNSLSKIIYTKVSLKPWQTCEMELFPQVVTACTGALWILSNISDGAFFKDSQKRKVVHCFCKKLHLECLRFWVRLCRQKQLAEKAPSQMCFRICFWIGFRS